MRKSVVALLFLAISGVTQAQVQLRAGHPEQYTVNRGDTLWGIAGKFLDRPWQWRELWGANPQIKDPDVIYPGDTLYLEYVNGEPRMRVNRGASRGVIKLSPHVRVKPMAEAIPTIALEDINSFLLFNRLVDNEQVLQKAPYVLGAGGRQVITGSNSQFFAKGAMEGVGSVYSIYRQAKPYTDPVTGEFLGINANSVGQAEVRAIEGDVATLHSLKTMVEIRIGDRLLRTEERQINSTFLPSAPSRPMENAYIIDVPRGVNQVGSTDVVAINKGARDGLVEGNVLEIYQKGETVLDQISGKPVDLPSQRAGLLMVFRTYDKASYALVLNATRPLSVMDKLRNP